MCYRATAKFKAVRIVFVLIVLDVKISDSVTSEGECYQRYDFSVNVSCPRNCSVSSLCEPLNKFRCVQAEDCHTLYVGGAVINNSCIACGLVGCDTCATTATCQKCRDAFELQADGKCRWRNYTAWIVIIVLLVLLSTWVVRDLFVMHRLPVTNAAALERGLKCRSRTKVRNEMKSGNPMYPLCTRMHFTPICGPGIPLLLNWYVFVVVVALWLLGLSVVFRPEEETFDSIHNACSVLTPRYVAEDNVAWDVGREDAKEYYDGITMWATLSYLGVTALSGIFFALQQQLWHDMDATNATRPLLHRFALEASGFPEDATDRKELELFWRSVMVACAIDLDSIAEMSIAYKFGERDAEINALIDQHLQEEEERLGNRSTRLSGSELESGSLTNYPGTFWVQALSFAMLGTDFEMCGRCFKGWSSKVREQITSHRRTELLRAMKHSGAMIVVFRTLVAKRAVKACNTLPIKFRGTHIIRVRDIHEEPCGVLWQNFGTYKTRARKVPWVVFVMVVVLVVWFFLYWPFSWFTKNSIGTESNISVLAETIAGMTIPVGNALVSFAVAYLMEFYGFLYLSTQRTVYLVVVVPCIFVNVLSDLYVTFRNSMLSLNDDLVESPYFLITFGMRVLVKDAFALLVPGYVFTPYVCEPFFCIFVRYWIAKLRIKQDLRITSEYAEELLMAPEIDIVNPPYGDIIACSATFMVTFLAPSRDHWKLFSAFAFFGIFVYSMNRIRILRWSRMTYFGSRHEHVAATHLWSIPLGILASSCAGHMIGGAGYSYVAGVIAFCMHNVIHFIVVRYMFFYRPYWAKQTESSESSYSDVVKRSNTLATYRNTNPIEVLKSYYLSDSMCGASGSEPLVLYRHGKAHLQPKAGKILDDETLAEDIHTPMERDGTVSDAVVVGVALDIIPETVSQHESKLVASDSSDLDQLRVGSGNRRPKDATSCKSCIHCFF